MSKLALTYYLKANRIFNNWRKFAWIFVPVIAFGGLLYPRLGLLVGLIMLTIMFLGLFRGKYWCGNLCPHGSLFDYLALPVSLNRKIPAFFKSPVTKWLFFIFYMFMFAQRLSNVMPFWGSALFPDRLGYLFTRQYLLMPTVVGLSLSIISPRTWCSFCPMGTFGQLMYKLGKLLRINGNTDQKVTIEAKEKCHRCATCARVCPMQLEPYRNFNEQNQFADENCIRCSTCVEHCPANLLWMANTANGRRIRENVDLEGFERRMPLQAVVEEIKPLADDVKEITFRLVDPVEVDYNPGQFILVKVSAEPEVYRAYSISSSDLKDRSRLRVTVQRVPGGYGSNIIHEQFEVGMPVELEGPMGNKLVVHREAKRVLLVAGGIGITPFVPVVKTLLEGSNSIVDLKLIYGVNKPDQFIYADYFEKLSAKSGKFELIKTVAFPDEDWRGYRGFVTDVMKQMDLEGYKIYLCGPRPMVDAALRLIEEIGSEKGIARGDVYYESA
ncbi:MAG: 4Fe-4S binding protein [Bacillota bacterium]